MLNLIFRWPQRTLAPVNFKWLLKLCQGLNQGAWRTSRVRYTICRNRRMSVKQFRDWVTWNEVHQGLEILNMLEPFTPPGMPCTGFCRGHCWDLKPIRDPVVTGISGFSVSSASSFQAFLSTRFTKYTMKLNEGKMDWITLNVFECTLSAVEHKLYRLETGQPTSDGVPFNWEPANLRRRSAGISVHSTNAPCQVSTANQTNEGERTYSTSDSSI